MNWGELDEHTGVILRTLIGRYRNTPIECIEDAVAEAKYRFIRVFHGEPGISAPQGAMAHAWLMTTAGRLVMREWRRRRRMVSLNFSQPEYEGRNEDEILPAMTVECIACSCDDPARQLEIRQELELMLMSLSPLLRSVIILHDIQGIPLITIAQQIGCSAATVRQRHTRALRQLRAIYRTANTE